MKTSVIKLNREMKQTTKSDQQPSTTPAKRPSVRSSLSARHAGKTHHFLHVGEELNLHKTARRSSASNYSATATIDLYRFTKKEALAELDKCLPKWIDAAMQGEHACHRTYQPVPTIDSQPMLVSNTKTRRVSLGNSR